MQGQSGLNIKQKRIIPACLIVLAFLITHIFIMIPGFYNELYYKLNDFLFYVRYSFKGKEKVSPYLIHIVTNDTSIEQLDISLWDRTLYGKLIEFLNEFDVSVIAFDIFFQDPGRPGDDEYLVRATRDGGNVFYPLIILPEGYRRMYPETERKEDHESITKNTWFPGVKNNGAPPAGSSVMIPFEKLASTSRGMGHINYIPDSDGKNRKLPLIYRFREGYIPSLSLRVLCHFLGVHPSTISVNFNKYISLPQASLPGRNPRDIRIPIDENGMCIINYTGPWTDSFLNFPVHKIMNARGDSYAENQLYDILENALIIISDISTRNKDYGIALYEPVYPLTGLHLNFINMVLTENYIREQGIIELILISIVTGFFLWLMFVRFRYARAVLFSFFGFMIITGAIISEFFICNKLVRLSPPGFGFLFSIILLSIHYVSIIRKEKHLLLLKYNTQQAVYKKLKTLKIFNNYPVDEIIKKLKSLEKFTEKEKKIIDDHAHTHIPVPENTTITTLFNKVVHKRELKNPRAFKEIITNDKKIYSIFVLIEAYAPAPYPVLIVGESGVGKELFARAIHQVSKRPGLFVAENIAGLDDTLFSDTLFGHEKGAYTGAQSRRNGLIVEAESGTLFLDEIGDLHPASQVKLLRLIQEGEYRSLGTDQVKKSETRLIFSTNRNLLSLVKQGKFRQDLFHRFTYKIHIPPLRERTGDIPFLVDHFLEKSTHALNKKKPAIPRELIQLLSTYHFPGNIRELETIIENAVRLHKGGVLSHAYFKSYIDEVTSRLSLTIREIPGNEKKISYSGGFPKLDEAERFLIKEALKKANNIQTIAARLLGITPSRLSRKLKRIDSENE